MKLQWTILGICMTIMSHAAIKMPCAKIILNSGRVIEAEILEVNPAEIRYKKCGQTTDVEYILAKETVLVIKNSQDEVIFVHKKGENDIYDDIDDDKKPYEAFSILAVIFAMVSPLIGAAFAGLSRKRMEASPHKFNKKSKTILKWAIGILNFYLGMIILTLGFFLLLLFGVFRK